MCKQLRGALLQIVSHTDLLDQTEILLSNSCQKKVREIIFYKTIEMESKCKTFTKARVLNMRHVVPSSLLSYCGKQAGAQELLVNFLG